MLKKALQYVANETLVAARRFPLPALFSLLYCIVSLNSWEKPFPKVNLLLILYCGSFLFISLQLVAQSRGWSGRRLYLIGVPLFLALAVYVDSVIKQWPVFTVLCPGLFLSVFIAPYLNRNSTSLQFWTFNYKLWVHFMYTVIATGIFIAGLFAIITSLHYLFGMNFYNGLYGDIAIIFTTLFAPLLVMAGIPQTFDDVNTEYPKPWRLLLSYIALPLLLAYAVILYGYMGKILLEWNLPKGYVAYMVKSFSCIGIVAYLIGYPLHSSQSMIGLFSRRFFQLLWVPLALLAIGIGVRVQEYGITEERYAILLCLVWYVLSALVVLSPYRAQAPKVIYGALVGLLLAASFGPWGMVGVSTLSQKHELTKLLEANHMLADGHIVKPQQAVSEEDKGRISSIVSYFVSMRKEATLRPLFAGMPEASVNKEPAPNTRSNANDVLKDMGIEYTAPSSKNAYRSMYTSWDENGQVAIAGYTAMINARLNPRSKDTAPKRFTLGEKGAEVIVTVDYDDSNNTLVLTRQDNQAKLVFALDAAFAEPAMRDQQRSGDIISGGSGRNEPYIDAKEEGPFGAKLVLNQFSGAVNKDDNRFHASSLKVTLFIKYPQ